MIISNTANITSEQEKDFSYFSKPVYSSCNAKITMLGRGFFSLAKAGIYLVGSGLLFSCRKANRGDVLLSHGSFHFYRGLGALIGVTIFRDRLIAPAFNAPKNPSEPIKKEDLVKLNESETDYYDMGIRRLTFFERRRGIRVSDWKGGICHGISADFASQMAKHEANLQTILKVTQLYSEGCPSAAVCFQFLSQFLTKTNKSIFYQNISYLLNGSPDLQKTLCATSKDVPLYSIEGKKELKKAVNSLKDGMYIAIIAIKCNRLFSIFMNNTGHSFIYIKNSEMSAIFDPNIGSIKVQVGDPTNDFCDLFKIYRVVGSVIVADFRRITVT